MSSRTRSTGLARSASSACRPFSAKATRCPSCSSVRARSRRLTRLSSTTSSSPLSTLRAGLTPHLAQGPRDALAFDAEALDAGLDAVQASGPGQRLEVPRQAGEGCCTEAGRVRLERVRGAPERVDVSPAERAAQRRHQLLRVLYERGQQLVEPAAHRGPQLLEGRGIQNVRRGRPARLRRLSGAPIERGDELLDAD